MAAPLLSIMCLLFFAGGIGLPGDAWLDPFAEAAPLDYSRELVGLAPLSNAYIDGVLGPLGPGARTGRGDAVEPSWAVTVSPGTRLVRMHALSNDDRDDAYLVPGVPFTARTDSAGASREADEPSACDAVSESTIWYRYTAAATVPLNATTFGTRHPTMLGVFDDGELVGCNRSALGNAIVQFDVRRDRTYLFQVGSPRGGPTVFNLDIAGEAQQVSPEHRGFSGVHQPDSFRSMSSAHGGVIAFMSTDPAAAPGFPPRQCAGSVMEGGPTTSSIYYTNLTGYNATSSLFDPCAQVVAVDMRTGRGLLASVSSTGAAANSPIMEYQLSESGRFVVFSTYADNLLGPGGDTNAMMDIFVHDLKTRQTERVSESAAGRQTVREDPLAMGDAADPAISFDGRFVAFESSASNLVSRDAEGLDAGVDVFVVDRRRGTIERVSLSSSGEPADAASVQRENEQRRRTLNRRFAYPCMSSNGRFVAFRSWATNFAPGTRFADPQVFLRDRLRGTTELISVSSRGAPAIGQGQESFSAPTPGTCVSNDGRRVLFRSTASNLAPGDRDGAAEDLFIRDRARGRTVGVTLARLDTRTDVDPAVRPGAQRARRAGHDEGQGLADPTAGAWGGNLTPDGRYASFYSVDPFVQGDDNAMSDAYLFDVDRRAYERIMIPVPKGLPTSPVSGHPLAAASFDVVEPHVSSDGRHVTLTRFIDAEGGGIDGTHAVVVRYRRGS